MRFTLSMTIFFSMTMTAYSAETPGYRDLMSDTWVATDQIGRTVSMYEEAGALREEERQVAIFYFLWLGHHGTYGPYDMTKIRAANPENPPWGPLNNFHFWAEPELGYYLNADEYVIRHHIHMLMDAGVDALFFDATNAVVYTKEYMTILEVMEEIRQEGGKTPTIAFFSHNRIIQRIYDELYAPGLYKDHWFMWDGKPLMISAQNPALDNTPTYDDVVAEFFTFRNMWGLQRIREPNLWSFLQHYPQDIGYNEAGEAEFMSVSTAQQETYMSYPTAHGKSYHNGQQPPPEEWDFIGRNFAEQFERAIEKDPKLIFITGWNEWVAQRFEDEQGNTRFTDAWCIEYNRDIEPMRGGSTDTQYYQMVDLIRQYKGARPVPEAAGHITIELDASFDQWNAVDITYYDHINDTTHRNNPGWDGAGPYYNFTGRNDFVELKVAHDTDNVYFYAETNEALTPHTDPFWMLLYINADQNPETGWEGYDMLVNARVLDENTTTLRIRRAFGWEMVAELPYRYDDNQLMLAIPREYFDEIRGEGSIDYDIAFDFHWADNIQQLDDITEFFLNGDHAPNRRFNYRYLGHATD